jgi:hypothetical protein
LAAVVRPRIGRLPLDPWRPIAPGTQTGKDDATMMKYFSPPIVVPIAILLLVVAAAYVRMH